MKSMIESLETRVLLSGEADVSFGNGGTATTNFDAFTERLTRVATDASGRVYAAGGVGAKFLVARFTTAGNLDPGFNGTGYVQVPLDTGTGATALTVAGGRVYVGGTNYGRVAGVPEACVVALTPAGQLDTTFGGNGVWTGTWGGGSTSTVAGLTAVGNTLYVGGSDGTYLGLARLTSGGEYDTTFGSFNSGEVLYFVGNANARAVDLTTLILPNQNPRYLVTGNTNAGPMIAAYTAGGVLDTNFNPMPFSSTTANTMNVTRVAADTLGRILVGGASLQNATVARLSATGNLDTAFGSGGFYRSPSTGLFTVSSLVALTGGGALFTSPMGGAVSAPSQITALTATGTKNLTYYAANTVDPLISNVADAVVQPDGKVLLAGRVYIGGDQWDTQVQRLNVPTQPTQIDGYVFDDLNADGIRNDNGGSQTFYGIAAYLDLNGNGVYDGTLAEPYAYAGTGKFVFDNIGPGTYTVRLTIGGGINAVQTLPAGNGGFVVTTSGPSNPVGPFGVYFPGATYAVQGYTYLDNNANGIQDNGDDGLSRVIVYDDVNRNGYFDGQEPSVTSNGNGLFTINLSAGNHTLRQWLPIGFRETGHTLASPNSGSTFAVDSVLRVPTDTIATNAVPQVRFGSRPLAVVNGFVFSDTNGNGIVDLGESGLPPTGVYVDTNNNGVYDSVFDPPVRPYGRTVGQWSIELPPGTYTVRQTLGNNEEQTTPTGSGATITIGATTDSVAPITLGRRTKPATPATFTVSGDVFVDTNKNKTRDGNEGVDGELAGWYVYVDTNASGGLDDSDAFVATTAFSGGNRYTLTLPADGKTYRVFLRNDNAPQQPFTTAAYYDVSSTVGGQQITGKHFGIAPLAAGAKASGLVYADANKNGKQDASEKGLAAATIYIDADNDRVRDANELWTTTDANGLYTFGNLPNTGSATRLRALIPAGSSQTYPTGGLGYQLNLAVNANNAAKNFGLYTPGTTPPPPPPPPPSGTTGSISGFTFNDSNKNGAFDGSDSYAAGKTVWLDLDDDGKLDSNEKSTVTSSTGRFSFNGVATGRYRVRRVFPTGYIESTPARYVTLMAGQTVSDVRIGSRTK